MTNDQKRLLLINAAIAVQVAYLKSSDEKLMLKLKARDAIAIVLAETVAHHITRWLQNEIVPHCEPFDDLHFLKMSALAGAVANGNNGLIKAYGERILQVDLGL
ncbi:hypothetical protein [Pseudomonas sp.]|uniref:hypothetical protein n=1 Tax=Pseudomonas sp. TaxID=306 RepID=UPI003F9BE336